MRVTVIRDVHLDAAGRHAARRAALAPLLRQCGDVLGVPARASLAMRLTGDDELRRLNRQYLDVDEPTDVLAFPGDTPGHVGDIAVSVERALAQTDDGVAELRLLAVHGLLHCLGHDHGDADGAALMTAATERLLPDQHVPILRPSAR
ncbi:MAG TPA: rRNA maturation RNase YbeY [Candidatus Dormibacteraeota bacterium]|jgi:probable rRNA maturation factor|nr:rRNA maturation RNase YbeY [Candidatus Dormibacteraeota bacterium]